ncbi:MAG: hypothetical protein M0T77_06110 [Actinomycetota bacterium]|nr:hypothetical protein [Actinomycetota bacterium]
MAVELGEVVGHRKALGIYDLPDDLPYVDLDDPQQLVDRGVRPAQVVERNRPFTQGLALKIYQESKYHGIRWWSFHRPEWRVWCLWKVNPTIAQVDDLTTSHIAVVSAARTLAKAII